MAEINSPGTSESILTPHAGTVVLGEPSWGVTRMFPAQGGWTEEEYLDLDLRCGFELHDGVLTCLPMPTHFHQKIVEYLFEALKAYINRNRLGYVYFAPFAVRLAPQRMRQPDVTFVRKQRFTDVHKTVEGADLLMEVVSPGDLNHERDWKVKRDAYAQAGVEEYWLVIHNSGKSACSRWLTAAMNCFAKPRQDKKYRAACLLTFPSTLAQRSRPACSPTTVANGLRRWLLP